MTARFFGEYLVQKKVIEPSALVSALLEQMTKLPTVAQIVFDQQWLTAEQMMKVFHQQQESGEEFTSACRTLGFWSDDLNHKLDEFIRKERVPVGQILVQRGAIDLKTLTKTLDDFLAQAEAPVIESSKTAQPAPVAETSVDPNALADIQDMFDERKRRAVKVAMGFIKDKNPPDENMMTKLMQDSLKITRTILGLLNVYSVESLQNLFREMERALDARMYASLFPMDEMQKAAEVITEAMDEAWALRDAMIRTGSDTTYMNESTGVRYQQVLEKLREIQ